jgi:hypothetical protein
MPQFRMFFIAFTVLFSFQGFASEAILNPADLDRECVESIQSAKFDEVLKRFNSLPANPVNTQVFSISIPGMAPKTSSSAEKGSADTKVILQIQTNGKSENHSQETCSLITYRIENSISHTKICCRLENNFDDNKNPFNVFRIDP